MEDFNHFASALESIFTIVAIVLGGIWVWRQFWINQEGYSHIQSSASIEFIRWQNDHWIVELNTVLRNLGKAPHKIAEFNFDLLALTEGKVENNEKADWNGQLKFPVPTEIESSYLPEGTEFFFIGPGVEAKYSYVACIKDTATVLCLHSRFVYADKRRHGFSLRRPSSGHTAEFTVSVPPKPTSNEPQNAAEQPASRPAVTNK